jgi:hypothetical protein
MFNRVRQKIKTRNNLRLSVGHRAGWDRHRHRSVTTRRHRTEGSPSFTIIACGAIGADAATTSAFPTLDCATVEADHMPKRGRGDNSQTGDTGILRSVLGHQQGRVRPEKRRAPAPCPQENQSKGQRGQRTAGRPSIVCPPFARTFPLPARGVAICAACSPPAESVTTRSMAPTSALLTALLLQRKLILPSARARWCRLPKRPATVVPTTRPGERDPQDRRESIAKLRCACFGTPSFSGRNVLTRSTK